MAWFLVPVLIWMIFMTFLLIPHSAYRNAFDRLTKAKYRDDRLPLQIMYDHFLHSPENWSITRDGASYPREGTKEIYLSYDGHKRLQYSLPGFGGDTRRLDGHFGSLFEARINDENSAREAKALLRKFYPELDSDRLLLR